MGDRFVVADGKRKKRPVYGREENFLLNFIEQVILFKGLRLGEVFVVFELRPYEELFLVS